MFDHDDRARRDLTGTDKFCYENGLMSDSELRNLEARYNFEDANKRFREEEERLREEEERDWEERRRKEEERRREEEERRSSSYSGGSYGGSKNDILDFAHTINNDRCSRELRDLAKKKVRKYLKENEGKDKRLDKELKKELNKSSFGGVFGIIIIGFILYFIFFS